MRAWLRRNHEWLWAPALYLAVVLVLYRETWLGVGGKRNVFGWDCLESFWPDLAYYARALGRGYWPLWNPYDRGGYPFVGDTHVGLYYPLTWLFVLPGAIADAMPPWTIQAKALLHHAVFGLMVHAWARSRRMGRAPAIFGGVVGIVSTPMIIHKASALLWPMVWMPLVWIAAERLCERADQPGSWRRGVLLGAAIGLAGSAGPPPGFFYLLVASVVFGGWRVATNLSRARWKPLAIGLACAVAIAIGLLAITVLPAGETVGESSRATRTMAYVTSNALPVGATLRGLFVPAVGKVDSYLGLAPLILALAGLACAPRRDRGAPWVILALAAGATLLSFGAQTPLLPWLARHVPGFDLFREANRYKVLAGMLIAPLAASGLGAILEADPARRRRTAIAVGVVGAVVLGIVLLVAAKGGLTPGWRGPSVRASVVIAVAITGIALALALGAGSARLLPALAGALTLLAWIDVQAAARSFVHLLEAPVDDREDLKLLAPLEGALDDTRIYDEFVLEQRPGSRLLVRDFRGYPSGDPFQDVRYTKVLERLSRNPELLEAFGVRWLLHGSHHRNGKSKNFVKGPPTTIAPHHFTRKDLRVFETSHPVPDVAWYPRVKVTKDLAESIDGVLAGETVDGVRRVAMVEQGDVPPALAASLAALAPDPKAPAAPELEAGRILLRTPNRVRAEIDAPAAGIVVTTEKAFAGWQVTVDGRAATPVRANVILRGVLVDAGPHVIEWTFHPPRYGALVALWLLSLAVVLGAAVDPQRIRRSALKA